MMLKHAEWLNVLVFEELVRLAFYDELKSQALFL